MLPFLSARQAAKLLGKTPRMAARRAKEAADQGDPNVIWAGFDSDEAQSVIENIDALKGIFSTWMTETASQ